MSVLFTVFAILTLFAAGLSVQFPDAKSTPRAQQVSDAAQTGFAKLSQQFANYAYTHSGEFPADTTAFNSSGGFSIPAPTPTMSYTYTYHPGTATGVLCLSGSLTDQAALTGFVDGAVAAGATVTSGLDCLGGAATVLSPQMYPTQASAVYILTNKTKTGPLMAIYPAQMSFRSTAGNLSEGKPVTLWNNGTVPVDISGVTVTPPFQQSNNCPASLPAKAKCVFTVRFAPQGAGNYSGNMTITNTAFGAPHTIALSGST